MNSKYLSYSIVISLILSCFVVFSTQGQQSPAEAGKTIIAKGQVSASAEQQTRSLSRKSPVFLADLVATGSASRTQMRMLDGGLLALQSDSQLAISNYQFDGASLQGSVSMELLKGGLRTITGKLRQTSGNYKLDTPVASIGVRGTHYEAELIDGDLHLAVWNGVIDVDVGSSSPQQFTLGDGQDYRFAIVTKEFEVIFLLNNPIAFSKGHSSDIDSSEITRPQIAFTLADKPQSVDLYRYQPLFLHTGESPLDNETDAINYLFDQGDIASRAGQVVFDQVEQFAIQSNAGDVADLSLSLQIDFDTASVPTGNLAFNDDNGEWFAVFNGLLQEDGLDLNINFASHNNQLAEGSIQSFLIRDGTAVLGNFDLQEVNAIENNVTGSFIVTEDAP